MSEFKRSYQKSDKPLNREEEEELLLENERLRCENALLKKLKTLIQAQEQAKKSQAITELRKEFYLHYF